MTRILLAAAIAGSLTVSASVQNKREQKVRADRYNVTQKGYWIYNDLDKGIERAKRTGKPLLVVLRCIPCEACAQLDSQVVERDTAVRKLMDQFVCVRIVHATAMSQMSGGTALAYPKMPVTCTTSPSSHTPLSNT